MASHLCPLGHSIQWVAPALLYVPFSHSTGLSAGLGHLEPAGHSEQLVAFSTIEKEPFAQGRCKESFSDGQCEPIGQAWQKVLITGAKLPFVHGTGSSEFTAQLGKEF